MFKDTVCEKALLELHARKVAFSHAKVFLIREISLSLINLCGKVV
jgi:hypothetical protein